MNVGINSKINTTAFKYLRIENRDYSLKFQMKKKDQTKPIVFDKFITQHK